MKKQFHFCLLVLFTCAIVVSCKKNDGEFPPPDPAKPDTLAAGWSKQIFISSSINDVVFYNNASGFAISGNGSIFRSGDGGQSWQHTYSSPQQLINIALSSATHGIFIGANGKVLVTRNGGASFDSITLADPLLFDVCCISSNNAVAVGRYFWTTADGGTTWTKGTDFSAPGKVVAFTDALNGWAGGEFGLKKTTDGGVTWQPVAIAPIPGSPVMAAQFLNNNTGFIATTTGSGKTSNGGASWSLLHIVETNTYHDIHFIDNNNGYLTDGRYLLKTTDGGGTWNIILRLGSTALIEVHFTDPGHGWAGAADGTIYRFLQ